jgi:hypothetical protein
MSDWKEHAKQRFDEMHQSHAAGGHTVAPNGHCVTCSRALSKLLAELHQESMQDPVERAAYYERMRPLLMRAPIGLFKPIGKAGDE